MKGHCRALVSRPTMCYASPQALSSRVRREGCQTKIARCCGLSCRAEHGGKCAAAVPWCAFRACSYFLVSSMDPKLALPKLSITFRQAYPAPVLFRAPRHRTRSRQAVGAACCWRGGAASAYGYPPAPCSPLANCPRSLKAGNASNVCCCLTHAALCWARPANSLRGRRRPALLHFSNALRHLGHHHRARRHRLLPACGATRESRGGRTPVATVCTAPLKMSAGVPGCGLPCWGHEDADAPRFTSAACRVPIPIDPL